jgi:hypothetical protein
MPWIRNQLIIFCSDTELWLIWRDGVDHWLLSHDEQLNVQALVSEETQTVEQNVIHNFIFPGYFKAYGAWS